MALKPYVPRSAVGLGADQVAALLPMKLRAEVVSHRLETSHYAGLQHGAGLYPTCHGSEAVIPFFWRPNEQSDKDSCDKALQWNTVLTTQEAAQV